ncbi:hypothetical protein [Novipirellula sp.]|uniref:hypothetical protein n=1 Tax=Novipirellula sp. TaxID=2795430 RepID=UPI00356596DA
MPRDVNADFQEAKNRLNAKSETPVPKLAAGGSGRGGGNGRGIGGGGNNNVASAQRYEPPPEKGLTPIFNAAAKGNSGQSSKKEPTLEERIVGLKKLLSKPDSTYELTPLGNTTGSYNPSGNRRIMHQIKALEQALAKQHQLSQSNLEKAALQNTAKRDFNRAAGTDMGM